MSWPLASVVLLALALLAGLVWYERSRPPARVVALVATLAALATLGRLAFLALPNVKPTTDIVLLTGYTLGGAPGFAVGAVTAVASNVALGQGPWTPWQMLAWGLCGWAGAALALASGRRLGRLGLALACALAGIGYGALMTCSLWAPFGGGEGRAWLALWLAGLPFDLAHALGNALFCLAFGPALVRMLLRFRLRLQVRWQAAPNDRVPARSAALVLIAIAIATAGALGATPVPARAATPAQYLRATQNHDGGWGAAPGEASSELYSAWAALGLAAAGQSPADVRQGAASALDYVRGGLGELRGLGDVERTILVLDAAGVSPRRVGGRDLIGEVRASQDREGSLGGQVNLTAFGILALRAGGESRSSAAIQHAADWLAAQQNGDGGFGFFRRGSRSDADDTGAALQALGAAGRATSSAARRGSGFLASQLNGDGGVGMSPGAPSNAQSTAWAIQGLLAVGRDPDRVSRGGTSLVGYLGSLQAPDGSVRYSRSSSQTPVWVTAQALLALAKRPLPAVRPRPPGAAPRTQARATAPARASSGARAAASPGRPALVPATPVAPRASAGDRASAAALVRAWGLALAGAQRLGRLAGLVLLPLS